MTNIMDNTAMTIKLEALQPCLKTPNPFNTRKTV